MEGRRRAEMENGNSNGKAIASLVLGIVSLVCIFFGYGAALGIILGVLGLVLGISAKKEAPSSMATAGVVLSIIGLALCAITFVACVGCVACVGTMGAMGSMY